MFYSHYLISSDNQTPYRELASNISDENLSTFVTQHYSHFCINEELSKEQFSIFTTQKDMCIGCINQLYVREKDQYCYLSHIYCADLSEREKLLSLLPNIIATATFDHIPNPNPNLSITTIPCREGDVVTLTYPKETLKQLVQASIDILLGKGNLFIVSDWEDCFDLKARDLMSQITSLLPYQCRRKLNFYSYSNNITPSETANNIVFCRLQDVVNLKEKYGDFSTFYFLQQQLSFPQIEIRPFADFAVEHSNEISEMLTYADRKLSGKLKNDPEFYDVLCHFKYVEKDESISNYANHRAWLIPNLSQLYKLGIASKKKALQLLENELHFEPDDKDVAFETKLSAFLYCFETGMVSKELMYKFLQHIRSCVDPIKWQLLCKQLDIPIEEVDNSEQQTQENNEESNNTEQAIDQQENGNESVEILSQPENYDIPDDDILDTNMQTIPENIEISSLDNIENETDNDMPFLSINLPAFQKEESKTQEENISQEKTTMLPKEILTPFIDHMMQSSNIIKYINSGCLHYQLPLYQEFYVQRGVAQYLASAVSCCSNMQELNLVRNIADQIKEYQVEAMNIIAEEVHRLCNERQTELENKEKQQKIAQKKQQETEMLSHFDSIFNSNDISLLENIDWIPKCIAANISKSTIDEYALEQYRKNKNALALLFLCCQYNTNGELQNCTLQNIKKYLYSNIRAKELKYEWLNDLASLPNLEKNTVFTPLICQFAQEDTEIIEATKSARDALFYLLVEKGILKSSSRKYFIFGTIVVATIAVVTIAGIILSSTHFLN